LNQKTPGTLLAIGGLLCLSLALAGVRTRSVLAAQEPDLRQQPSDKEVPSTSKRPKRDAHVSLGLGRVPDAAAAKRGEPLFQANCQACHGAQARGGQAPSLVRSVLVLHDDDDVEIPQIIKNGRTGGMPAFTNLTDAERHDIAEYLHQEVELAANRGLYTNASKMTTGDVARGKVFFAANCASCHSVTGDLAKVGAKYSQPAVMLARIAWPAGHEPRQATVTTAEGKTIKGTLVHYDDFETTLKATDGKTGTWPTDSIKVDIPDKLSGHRALLPKYTDDDLHDLTRYLLELK
jgi:cytochrome c oxidase cbb3-type subunit III